MTVLVTGSSGMIGTALCESLTQDGVPFLGVDKRPNQWSEEINRNTFLMDLLVDDFPAVGPVDCIVHLAANARVHPIVIAPALATDNSTMTDRVYQHARREGVKRVVNASSREVYGDLLNGDRKVSEEEVRHSNCTNQYAAGKLQSEALSHAYRVTDGIDSVITRFSNVYGKYDVTDRFVPIVIRKVMEGKPITIYGGTGKTMDFTFVDDVAAAIRFIIDNFDAMKVCGWNDGAYNISPGEGKTLCEVAEKLMALLGRKVELKYLPNRKGEPMHYVADTSKATGIGLRCDTSIDDGLMKAVAFYKSIYAGKVCV